jgi:hypothetical protein
MAVIIHDLGGVSSALGLRAEALSADQTAADRLALQAIAEQLRDITRILRLLQGPNTSELMSPMKEAPAQEWWRLTSRLLAAALPRKMVVEHHLDAALLSSAEVSVLSMLMMLAARDLTARGWRGAGGLRVQITSAAGRPRGAQVTLAVPLADWPSTARRAVKRWSRYAERLAGRAGAQVEWWVERHDKMEWRCSIGGNPRVEEYSIGPAGAAITPKE